MRAHPIFDEQTLQRIFFLCTTFFAGSLEALHNFPSWNSRCNKPCGDRESPSQ
jgi:hypothetical protein